MANIKFSGFTAVTDISAITEIVGYNGTQNVRISPANFLNSSGGPFLPLTGGTLTGNVNFNDNVYARFGNGNDLDIGHDASDSYITHSGVGNLIIQNTEDNKDIRFASDNGSGGTTTYLTIDGLNEFTKFSKPAFFLDGVKAFFGNSYDLQIYHDGSNSYIQDTGAGDLILTSNASSVQINKSTGVNLAKFIVDGSVELYHNSTKKFETTSTGVTISAEAIVGNGTNGLQFSHSAGNSSGIINTAFNSTVVEIRTGNVERMRINGSGNVGIGTTTPDQKLTVNGTIKSLGGGSFANAVTFGGALNLQNNITILNKAQTTYIPFATRDTSGSEVVMDLTNVSINGGAVGPYLPLAGGTLTGALTVTGSVTLPDTEKFKGTTYSSSFLSFWNDTTLSASDDIIFAAAGGVEKMRLTSTGLGIGTSAPTAKLSLSGSQTALDLTRGTAGDSKWGLSSDSTALYIAELSTGSTDYVMTFKETSGNVGIGTTSPGFPLHVSKSVSGDYVSRITNTNSTSGSNYGLIVDGGSTAADVSFQVKNLAGGSYLMVRGDGNVGIGTGAPKGKLHVLDGAAGSYTPVSDSDTLIVESETAGGISLVGTGSGSNGNTKITFGTPSDLSGAQLEYSFGNGYLRIGTTSASNTVQFMSGNGVECMRLSATQMVGIGTSAPLFKLQVAGSVALDVMPGNQSEGIVRIGRYDANTTRYNDIKSFVSATAASNYLKFAVHGGVENATVDVMTLLGSGNVGIGLTNPAVKLHIKGTTDTQARIEAGAASGEASVAFYEGGNRLATMGATNTGEIFTISADSSLTYGMRFSTNDTERMRLDASGNLSIGSTSNPGYKLKLEGTGTLQLSNRTGSDGAVFAAANDGVIVGTITVSGSATAYNTSSDYRLKEDLQDFKGLDLVSKIPVYDFKWKVDESRSYGVMAHELKKVLPQAVSGDKDAKEMQSVDYSKIVPLLVKSIQELKAEIELLKK